MKTVSLRIIIIVVDTFQTIPSALQFRISYHNYRSVVLERSFGRHKKWVNARLSQGHKRI